LLIGVPYLSIQNLIASVNERFTPTERRIAEGILDDPMLLTFGTVTGLADRIGTSRASIVRFATKLGFEGYSDLQRSVRDGVSQQLTSPSHRVRQQDESLEPGHFEIEGAMHAAFDVLDKATLTAMAAPIITAQNVWILSGETSMAGAYALHSGLTMIRSNVRLVQEHSTGRDLCGALPGDVAVVFDFARYRRNAIVAARTLSDLGVTIVAITDGPLSPLSSLTKIRCELKVPAVGPFDSSVPAVIAAELLVAQVVHGLGDEALDRIDRLEVFWQATGMFLNYSSPPSRES
jgi:DNA-binding MurR/RpiR family transcriptional regulator